MMVEGMEIRALAPADAEISRDLIVWASVAWGSELTDEQIEQRAKRLADGIASAAPDKVAFLVARRAGVFVGQCRVFQDKNESSQWWLSGLVVDPAYRRQRVATALVAACIDYARNKGASAVRSETDVENLASIRLHEGVGFENLGQFTDDDGDEKVALQLILRDHR